MSEENTLKTDTTPTPSRVAWWKFVLLVLAIGPFPILTLALIDDFRLLPAGILKPPTVIAFFGAFWGLAAGVLRGSLLRMMLGLNVGAVVGFCAGYYLENSTRNIDTFLEITLLLAPSYGVILAAVCSEWRGRSVLKWFGVGVLVIAVLTASGWCLQALYQILYPSWGFKIVSILVCPALALSVLVYFVRAKALP